MVSIAASRAVEYSSPYSERLLLSHDDAGNLFHAMVCHLRSAGCRTQNALVRFNFDVMRIGYGTFPNNRIFGCIQSRKPVAELHVLMGRRCGLSG